MPDATGTQQELSEELDKALLEVIRKGRMIFDKQGKPMTHKNGKPIMERARASDLQAAIARLRALGITKVVAPDDAAAQLAEELGLDRDPNIIKMPRLSEEDDAATGTG